MKKDDRVPRTIYLVWKANSAVKAFIDNQREGDGLTLARYVVLSFLASRDDLTSANLARRIGVSPQSMNETVAILEKAGLLEKYTTEANRKSRPLRLTPAGRAYFDRSENAIDVAEQMLFEKFSAKELEQFRTSLATLAELGKKFSIL